MTIFNLSNNTLSLKLLVALYSLLEQIVSDRETNLVQKCHHLKQYTAMQYAAFPERALGV